MSLQRESVGKRGGTNVALERFLARVYFSVILQVSGLTERGAAGIAFVRLLPGVDPPVVPQRGVPREALVAHLANIWFFSRMRPLVVFQMWRL